MVCTCATRAAPSSTDVFALRRASTMEQRIAGYKALHVVSARCRVVSRDLAIVAHNSCELAGDAPQTRALTLSWATPQPSELQPRVRTGAAGCTPVAHVRPCAHTCSRVRSRCRTPSYFAQRSANELVQRAAGWKALHAVKARCRVELCGGANAARHGLAFEASQWTCRNGGRAAAKPAAAARAHKVTHVRTRAHGCATGAAFQTISRIRTANRRAGAARN
jgi:hypothetical protein